MRSGSGGCGPAGFVTTPSTELPISRALVVIVHPDGAYLTALSSRLSRIWCRRSGSAATGGMSAGTSSSSARSRASARGRTISNPCCRWPPRSTAVMWNEIDPASTRARSRSSWAMRRTRSDSSWTMAAARNRSFSVLMLPSTSAWLNPIRLVNGVLSSCETLARNSRWTLRARSTAARSRGRAASWPRERAAHEQHQEYRQQQRCTAREQQPGHEVARRSRGERSLRQPEHDGGSPQRVACGCDRRRRDEVGLAAEYGPRLRDPRDTF